MKETGNSPPGESHQKFRSGRKSRLWRLHSHLIGLVIAATLPMLAFAVIVVTLLVRQQKQTLESSLLGSTRIFAATVDERLASIISGLSILSASEEFRDKDYGDFHRRATRTVRNQAGWFAITLADTSGKQILNTLRPFGSPLPSVTDLSSFQEVMRTGEAAVSGYRIGAASGRQIVVLQVPVKREGKIRYVLGAEIRLDTLSDLLRLQRIPADWRALILDQNGQIIARSRNPETYLGHPGPAGLEDHLEGAKEGVFEGENKEGLPQLAAFRRSRVSGWTVVLGIPKGYVSFVRNPIFLLLALGGGTLLLLAVILGTILGKRIAGPIIALADSAAALGEGGEVISPPSRVAEVAQVSAALKTAAEQRKESDGKAQDAIQLRDNFLSVASHELKTPLTALQLQFQLLARKVRASESIPSSEMQGPMDKMLGQVKRLSRLIDDLLDVSRISSGRLEQSPEPLELSSLLSEISQQFAPEQERTGSTILVRADGPVNGLWDRSRLEQVFTNLITNAFKYGSGNPIEVSVKEEGEWALVSVKDSGIGIAGSDQKRIFDRFERAVSSRNYGGLGLGLWIVRRVVEDLKGEVTVESNPGSGSVFSLKIPKTSRPTGRFRPSPPPSESH